MAGRIAKDPDGNPIAVVKKTVSLDGETLARLEAIQDRVPRAGGLSPAIRWAVAIAFATLDDPHGKTKKGARE